MAVVLALGPCSYVLLFAGSWQDTAMHYTHVDALGKLNWSCC